MFHRAAARPTFLQLLARELLPSAKFEIHRIEEGDLQAIEGAQNAGNLDQMNFKLRGGEELSGKELQERGARSSAMEQMGQMQGEAIDSLGGPLMRGPIGWAREQVGGVRESVAGRIGGWLGYGKDEEKDPIESVRDPKGKPIEPDRGPGMGPRDPMGAPAPGGRPGGTSVSRAGDLQISPPVLTDRRHG